MATERSYYEILGVERNADDAAIKRAFRKLAQQWHPDVSSEPGAAERFKEINEAYQVLSDPKRRQIYDMVGRPASATWAARARRSARASPGSATCSTLSSPAWAAPRRCQARSTAGRLGPPL